MQVEEEKKTKSKLETIKRREDAHKRHTMLKELEIKRLEEEQ